MYQLTKGACMKFNSVAISKMYVKVVFKKRPYSNEIVCLQILASDDPKVTTKTAFTIYDFDKVQVEDSIVQAHIERIRKQNNYATVEVL
jgi:hypothetical protein